MPRIIPCCLAALALALAASAASAQDYPSKPIKLIAPLAAASAVDAAARVVAAKMSENMGQQIGRASCRERV